MTGDHDTAAAVLRTTRGDLRLRGGGRMAIMGIVNATPDSFSG